MLKKSVAWLLTLLYAGTVIGFALNVHYCGSIRLSVKVNAVAQNCGMDKLAGKMKCCKDNRLNVKVKDSHQAALTTFLAKVIQVETPIHPFGAFLFAGQSITVEQLADRAPPDHDFSRPGAVYLKYRNLRI